MTIAIGFMLGSGAVLCADSQEVVGDYAKTTTHELCNEEVARKIGALPVFEYQKMLDTLRATVREIHEQHIWPRQAADRPWFSMLIALQGINPAARALFFTQDSIVLPVDHYKSIGVGSYLADYLHDRIYPTPGWDYNSTPEEAARNAIFILDQVKSAIQGCDGQTIAAVFGGDGTFRWVIGSEAEQIEGWFSEFNSSTLLLRSLFSRPETNDQDFDRELLQFNANMKLLRARQAQDAETHTKRYAEFIKAQKQALRKAQ